MLFELEPYNNLRIFLIFRQISKFQPQCTNLVYSRQQYSFYSEKDLAGEGTFQNQNVIKLWG